MKEELYNYDIYPKVFIVGEPVTITIKPLGAHAAFEGEYVLSILPAAYSIQGDFLDDKKVVELETKVKEDGCIRFTHVFPEECEYIILLKQNKMNRLVMSVYALAEDMRGRYPYRGDLHIHTCRSDGTQSPAVVVADYRKEGYDFAVISDHYRYYPSLEAIDAYKEVPHEMTIVRGEEVHLPPVDGAFNDVHIVNFGGEYSINALTEGEAVREKGTDPKYRSLNGECPPSMSKDEYDEMMRKLCAEADLPANIDRYAYVCCKWIFDQIRKANGLGIFAHPNWISNVFHVPEAFTEYMMETQPFDAFEVLGGENYYEQNGFQTIKYYEDRAKGRRYPIVGSTDSHNSYESSRNSLICSTIVFSPENEQCGRF